VDLSGDPDRLQQVVGNLLANAVKFTPAGGRVTVRLTRAERQVRITVSDTGRGISAALLPHVFEAFRQGERSGPGGLGLGLAIVRQVVELHGGSVQVESPGRVGARPSPWSFRESLRPPHRENVRRPVGGPPRLRRDHHSGHAPPGAGGGT
jgi:signal transduction histidine kinase